MIQNITDRQPLPYTPLSSLLPFHCVKRFTLIRSFKICTKLAEMFSESIPGTILQMYALVKSNKPSKGLIFSISISALTTGFASATVSFDKDTSPAGRKNAPSFYGYVANRGPKRSFIFIFMILFSAINLLLMAFTSSLLASINPMWLLSYFTIGMSIFLLLFKIARDDFRYMFRVDGVLSWICSFMLRLMVKTVTDFTGWIHARHPYEMGGMVWVINLFAGQVVSIFSVHLHFSYDNGSSNLNEIFVWKVVFLFLLASLLSFTGFLACMDSKYIHTFFSTETGTQFLCNIFRNAKTDEERCSIFKKHRSYYSKIEDEVKKWLNENWEMLEAENAKWFVISLIPTDLLPEIYIERLPGRGRERRSSLSLRDVVRRVSVGESLE